MEETSLKEKRIRKITNLYYSRQDVQNAIFEFSKDREVVPRYFEGFGKRPDSFQYKGDIFELVKNGATSFHCSEELWKDPLQLSTEMTEEKLSSLRIGWDLLIDIDSKYIDYSKIMAEVILKILKFHGVKNIGIKFSGSKGFHIIIPWKAFPKEINQVKTSELFPEWPRIITQYLMSRSKAEVTQKINELSYTDKKYSSINKYIKREEGSLNIIDTKYKNSMTEQMDKIKQNEESYSKEVLPDLILVSPRHLFRAPYSLHEKTALASVVLNREEIKNFDLKDADPMKVEVKSFLPDSQEGEAKELLIQALDWYKQNVPKKETKKIDFKPIKLENLSDSFFPPSIKKILEGVGDGRKRALFVLLNLFRSIGMEKEELEKRINDWNKKNKIPLKEGYIKAQLSWGYRNKPVLPPNFDKDYYKGIGVIPTPEELRIKNPVNYIIKKSMSESNKDFKNNKKE
jgi:DNA primase catalytic subunit